MKILVFGSSGFIGRSVADELKRNHIVYSAVRREPKNTNEILVDLLDLQSTHRAIRDVAPEAIVNAAGIVENSKKSHCNVMFTKNILTSITALGSKAIKIVICGSAAVYGNVEDSSVPVSENQILSPISLYGESKKEEELTSLKLATDNDLDVVIARIFNPIGPGMSNRFLLSRLREQIALIKRGERHNIEVSRLDSVRDYINVRDVAAAIKILVENKTKENIYNVGSGKGTSNEELVRITLGILAPNYNLNVIETEKNPEIPVASVADITRMHNEFGWAPRFSLDESIDE